MLRNGLDEALVMGVSAKTGRPLPDVTPEALSSMAAQEGKPDRERSILESRAALAGAAFGVVSEIQDPNDLAEAGWGVVFARDCDPWVRQALQPLLDIRKKQAGDLFKVFNGSSAPAPGEPAAKWIARNGATLDVVDPHNGIPYFLLLIGSPESIPFEFQYTLDIYWAVGRLFFPTSAEYTRYAASVVAYETAPVVKTSRQVALLATAHDFDRATQLFTSKVAEPLAKPDGAYGALGSKQKFALRTFLGSEATKGNFSKILKGEIEGGIPALIFSGTHGMEFEIGDARQPEAQGALVCQDWHGYGSIEADHWFAARDVPDNARLAGLIHFCFSCYSAGCPREDNFARTEAGPRPIAEHPMIARLPQAMLAHPGGGALASLGHIDRAWAYTFVSDRGKGQVQSIRDVLARILLGHRIGHATDQFNIKWAALSTYLSESLQAAAEGNEVPKAVLANRWIARDDARNYTILGDPAVRLRVDDMPPFAG
jgi:Peptidase family C25